MSKKYRVVLYLKSEEDINYFVPLLEGMCEYRIINKGLHKFCKDFKPDFILHDPKIDLKLYPKARTYVVCDYDKVNETIQKLENKPLNYDFILKPFLDELIRLRIKLFYKKTATIDEYALIQKFKEKTSTDYLTGAWNRRGGMPLIHSRLRNSKVNHAIIVADIDDFKILNDTNGHLGGDKILKVFADCINEIALDHRVFMRMGGDEFILYFRYENESDIHHVIEELYSKINFMKRGYNATFSAGIATSAEVNSNNFKNIFEAADDKLYKVKNTLKAQIEY